jgi:2-desacetyl-2-hydroxyethyl bacteriochlorophyllide A dehydrogenase
MKAIVLSDARAPELRDLPEPKPCPHQVLLQVDYCGICGSDLHAATYDIYRTGIVMGHEFCGRIVEAGKDVQGWRAGDRVCVNPNGAYCGACDRCRRGLFNLCPQILKNSVGAATPGGFAEFTAVDARTLHRLPDEVTGTQGAWVEPASVALRAVRRSEIKIGDHAIVFGAGPIGLLVVMMLRAAGAGHITVVEPSPARRSKALSIGADRSVNPEEENLEDVLASDLPAPVHAFDCVGSSAIVDLAIRTLKPQGRLTVVGVAQEKVQFRSTELIFKEIDVRGSFIYTDEFSQTINLLATGQLDVDVLTSDIRSLNHAVEAFSDMRAGGDVVKILIKGIPH